MKKMTTILSVVLMSSTVFAANCNSLDLAEGQKRIQGIEGLSIERQASHLNILKNAKTTQILACASLGEDISQDDARFAIGELVKSRIATIQALESQIAYMKSQLSNSELSSSKRELFSQNLALSSNQLDTLKNTQDSAITKITKLTK